MVESVFARPPCDCWKMYLFSFASSASSNAAANCSAGPDSIAQSYTRGKYDIRSRNIYSTAAKDGGDKIRIARAVHSPPNSAASVAVTLIRPAYEQMLQAVGVRSRSQRSSAILAAIFRPGDEDGSVSVQANDGSFGGLFQISIRSGIHSDVGQDHGNHAEKMSKHTLRFLRKTRETPVYGSSNLI